ncbi:hypothetical protein LSH36_212g04017 [Paralvinella palmiformis]|uniref:Uncharacterized protein n=1 Tax=Paralvinella palmiformis TaxID=53620 RepID=A0AAD9JQW3_9ANNE|nr:hypothetical protein LSH36_212g04017 [Paralvinella palmiformis]
MRLLLLLVALIVGLMCYCVNGEETTSAQLARIRKLFRLLTRHLPERSHNHHSIKQNEIPLDPGMKFTDPDQGTYDESTKSENVPTIGVKLLKVGGSTVYPISSYSTPASNYLPYSDIVSYQQSSYNDHLYETSTVYPTDSYINNWNISTASYGSDNMNPAATPGQAGYMNDAAMPGQAGYMNPAAMPGQAGYMNPAAMPGQAGYMNPAAMPGQAGYMNDATKYARPGRLLNMEAT